MQFFRLSLTFYLFGKLFLPFAESKNTIVRLDKQGLNWSRNCTPAAINDFPPDLFSEYQRSHGAIFVHFLASCFIFYAIYVVCSQYLLPSIEKLCQVLKIPNEVAGSTFLAIGSSSPELFVNIVGTFVTKGDIGLGGIIGTSVFNILVVTSMIAFSAGKVLQVDWYPVSRDCVFQAFSIVLLLIVIQDGVIMWFEALILVLTYVVYILIMVKNETIHKGVHEMYLWLKCKFSHSLNETTSLIAYTDRGQYTISLDTDDKNANITESTDKSDIMMSDLMENPTLRPPKTNIFTKMLTLLGWPIRMVFRLTIPDIKTKSCANLYPLTLIVSTIWIGILTYTISWMITIIGNTFGVPDSIMGMTLLAIGTSVPECVSAILIAKIGLGTLCLGNTVGSNCFDILLGLGLPWLVRDLWLMYSENDLEAQSVRLNSQGVQYSVGMLLVSLAFFYLVLFANKFRLNRTVCLGCLAVYAVFLPLATLFELDVFFTVSLPQCPQ